MKNANFNYIGKITLGKNSYEVVEDDVNNVVNLFYKNRNKGDVECWSFKREDVDIVIGKTLLEKTKKHWINVLDCGTRMLEILDIKPFLQTFPIDFWDDVITPLKKGKKLDMTIEMA